jgi:hypothetical protein
MSGEKRAAYPDFEDLPITVGDWVTKGEYRKQIKRDTTIRELLDTWDIDDPAEDTEIAQVMRLLRAIHKRCQRFQIMVDDRDETIDDLVAKVDRMQAALIAILDRNEFDGPSLDYMQGYRNGQEHLARLAREAIKPPLTQEELR